MKNFWSLRNEGAKLITIVGPTASGKSDYAARLAKKVNGEIISADSRQVYRGLDIGTSKIKGQICTDIADMGKPFSVIEWKKCAEEAITTIYRSGKTPILVGGTAFYIRALVDGITIPEVPPNQKLRRKLDKRSIKSLLGMLEKKDPARAKTVDRKNKRRVIRALEIVDALGKVPELKTSQKYIVKFIGIKRSSAELKKRIVKRTNLMIKKGLIREVRKLRNTGVSWKRFNELGFEYKYPALYIRKKISRQDMLDAINRETIDYARRQMLWWKKDKRIRWTTPRSCAQLYD